MLYQLYETQRSFMEPFADLAQAASKLYSNPLNPASQTPMAQRVSAAYALLHRLGKDYVKPEFGIRTVKVGDQVDVAIHERIEIDKPFCELRRFKRFSDDPDTLKALKQQPPVLIVAPLSGHYATLLRDTVRTMLQDHKVYITDWKNARLVPLSEGEFHLHDYVNYVQEFIRHVQSIYGNCHVMSVCQPTVPVLAAVSLMASRGEKTPLTMTMMGGPIDARKSPTAVNNLAIHKSYEWFENNVIYRVPPNFPGAGRRVYPGFLQHTGFVAMNPDRHASSHYDYFKDLIKGDDASAEAHRKFYDEYNAVLDMDADYYLDDISGSGPTRAAQDLCSNIPRQERQHLEVEGAGHYGIFSGRRWREVVYPLVSEFIRRHARPQATRAGASAQASASRPAKPAAKPAAKPKASSKVSGKAIAKAPAKARAKAAPATATKAPARAASSSGVKTQWVKVKA